MRICLVIEGSYPYIKGGVASWVNTVIRAFPEHDFVLYTICAEDKMLGVYKYDIPENVVEIVENSLECIKFEESSNGLRYNIGKEKDESLTNFFLGEEFDWFDLFELMKEKKLGNPTDFLMSQNFFDYAKKIYDKEFATTPFTDFIWTIRSMYLILFYILTQPVPEADIYHSVATGYAGVIAAYGKYLCGGKTIITEHGIYTREREGEIIKAKWVKGYWKELWIKFFYSLSNCSYKHADAVTALFNMNRTLQLELGCPEEKILTIPNGVELERFADVGVRENNPDEVNIGAIVRVVEIKDIKTMIHAFALVKKEVPYAKLYIMGPIDEDPDYYKECIQNVEMLGVKDVIFTGGVDVVEYLKIMDFLLLTSISEGQPLAVMEGLAAKKAFVTTNVGDCHDLLFGFEDNFGQAGYIEYVMDHVAIAQSAIKLCNDYELRTQMGINGYNRIEAMYQKKDFLKQYDDLYNKLYAEKGGK